MERIGALIGLSADERLRLMTPARAFGSAVTAGTLCR